MDLGEERHLSGLAAPPPSAAVLKGSGQSGPNEHQSGDRSDERYHGNAVINNLQRMLGEMRLR